MESANFGECVCGEPRDHHSPEALGNATKGGPKHGQRNSADVREGFLQKETVSCTNFVLDMSPDALFGQCVNCGQPRNKHSDAALKGAPADVGAPGALAKEASKYTSQDVLEVAEPPKPASASRTRGAHGVAELRHESAVLASCGPAVQIDRARGCGAPDGHRDAVFRFSLILFDGTISTERTHHSRV